MYNEYTQGVEESAEFLMNMGFHSEYSSSNQVELLVRGVGMREFPCLLLYRLILSLLPFL